MIPFLRTPHSSLEKTALLPENKAICYAPFHFAKGGAHTLLGKVGALNWERGHHLAGHMGAGHCVLLLRVSTLPSHSSQPQNLFLLFCVVVNIKLIIKLIF